MQQGFGNLKYISVSNDANLWGVYGGHYVFNTRSFEIWYLTLELTTTIIIERHNFGLKLILK